MVGMIHQKDQRGGAPPAEEPSMILWLCNLKKFNARLSQDIDIYIKHHSPFCTRRWYLSMIWCWHSCTACVTKNLVTTCQSTEKKKQGSSLHQCYSSLIRVCQHVWNTLALNCARSTWHHTRAHIQYKYCMRPYSSQVSSSYVPDGVSPSCLPLLARLHTHAHHRSTTKRGKLWAPNTIFVSALLFSH